MKAVEKSVIYMIKIYRAAVSPFLGKNCRFHPTCSEYMIESIEYKGLFRGVLKGVMRIARCHPFNSGGYDPVRK
ncbi:MAG: membrane protein insertion efficiency factor YidD [Elusimicrobia bacterium]|nr:membrane protein insertion efficiency factor YidD [Elusimicrobiota bacterium]